MLATSRPSVSLSSSGAVPRSQGHHFPAQIMFGGRRRPPAADPDSILDNQVTILDSSGRRSLRPPTLGTAVRVQQPQTKRWDEQGMVTNVRHYGRSQWARILERLSFKCLQMRAIFRFLAHFHMKGLETKAELVTKNSFVLSDQGSKPQH